MVPFWTQRLELFFFSKHKKWINELNLFEYNAKNGTLFQKWPIELNLFLWTFFSIWLTELNLCQYDSKNWIFFNMTQRIEHPFLKYESQKWTFFEKMTQRIGTFFSIFLKELNPFSKHDSQNWTIFCQIWRKESKPFSFHKIKITLRIEPFLKNMFHSENSTLLNLFMWLRELDFFFHNLKTWCFFFQKKKFYLQEPNFFQYDSKNWTFFSARLKELNFFF